MSRFRKMLLVLVASLAVALGAAAIPASPASAAVAGDSTVAARAAAAPCSAKDQRYGRTQVRVTKARDHKKFTTRKLRQAKRVDQRRDTRTSQKRLNQARKANRKAIRNLRTQRANRADARQAAERCHRNNNTTPPMTPGQAAAFQQILDALAAAGLSAAQLQAITDQIAEALAGAGGGGGGLTPEQLAAALQPVVDALTAAGLPADQLSEVLQQVLDALSAGNLPSDPDGLIDLIVDAVQDALTGTPLEELNPILEQVQDGLDDLLGGLLGGLPRS
ncbi:hypothetical protein [Nocardioides dongxiaopingii]|uniref:hypothetical protein n=1 Tax=Nocardioides dongxiaopingii TaxID=2576036 RepID=UPI0010C7637A|nr:hypothetical protein [Nocardioides dongxiaopingii]